VGSVSHGFAPKSGPAGPSVASSAGAAVEVAAAVVVEPAGDGAVVATVVPAAVAAADMAANTAVKLGAAEALESAPVAVAAVFGVATGVAVFMGMRGLCTTRVSEKSEEAIRNPFDLICGLLYLQVP
jgi:hypothetical protein